MFEEPTSNSVVSGINEAELTKTIVEIEEIAEELNKLFSRAEVIMLNARDCYSSDAANKLFDSFDDFKTNFNIIVANVQNYGNDLNKVKNNFLNMRTEVRMHLEKGIGKEGK